MQTIGREFAVYRLNSGLTVLGYGTRLGRNPALIRVFSFLLLPETAYLAYPRGCTSSQPALTLDEAHSFIIAFYN